MMRSLLRGILIGTLGFGGAHIFTLLMSMAGGEAVAFLIERSTTLDSNYLADPWAAPVVCAVGVAASRIALHLHRRSRPLGVGFLVGTLATFAAMAISSFWLAVVERTGMPASERGGLVSYAVAAGIAAVITTYLGFVFLSSSRSSAAV